MTSLNIRAAQKRDLQRLHEMIQALACFHGDFPKLTVQTLEQTLFGPAPGMFVLVAEQGDRLVGYAALHRLFRLHFGIHGMDLHHMFVDARARSQGIGRALIEASITHAKSCGCSYLMVGTHPDNITAQDMYLANGFETASKAGPRFRMRLD